MPNEEEIENMKLKISYAVLFVLICSFCAFGQRSAIKSTPTKRKSVKAKAKANPNPNPCSHVETVTDRMTDKTRRYTEAVSASNEDRTSILINVAKSADSTGENSFFHIQLLDNRTYPICIPRGGEVIILFEDGSKVTESTYNPNCEGTLDLLLDISLVRKLKSTKVSTMRVYTNYGYVEADFEPAESKQLLNDVNCVYQ